MKKIVLMLLALVVFGNVLGQPTYNWSNKVIISDIEYAIGSTITVTDTNGGKYYMWVDCTYYQCFQNKSEDLPHVLALLMYAKSNRLEISFYGYEGGGSAIPGRYFNKVKMY